ncbi:MAG: pyridoxamine 5'-phosphate oxidase family protein [Chloroflexota bacterium]|nr:pyridoxamine 5'-phosphate oxidase family protein [Chloroflexota bacterium]
MPSEIVENIDEIKPFPVATASPEGKPNLIYVSFLRVLDDETLQLADNFFFKTRKNLEANPVMAVTFWGDTIDDCYQVKGPVEIETEGRIYEDCVKWVQSVNGDMKPKAAAILHVEEIYSGKEQLA